MTEEPRTALHPILIAEDNPDDASLLQLVFKRARILNPLQIVHDGEEAIEYLRGAGQRSARDASSSPALFLLDLKMPRKGGLDVLRWLSENPPEAALPVVVIAGAGEMREVNCAYSLGARSFLIKPLSWLDVMELLSCFRELRMVAQGENYILEPVEARPSIPLVQKPVLCGYKPQPLDTSRLKLTDDIQRLTELLAENNHEVWARDRMAQGWTFGPKRNDDRKEHPCLIPYRDLPESEKLVDRNVAIETIKTIFSFGLPFPVMEKTTEAVRGEVIGKTLETLRKEELSPVQLRNLWEEHNALVWTQNVELYRHAMAAALRCGESFLALDIAAEGLKKHESDLHLGQMQAVALARTGGIESAHAILERLRSTLEPDEQTLMVLARTYRELADLDAHTKRRHLKLSFELYSEAYKRTRTYGSGINAAVTGLLYGEKVVAIQIAEEVEGLCRSALEKSDLKDEERFPLHYAKAQSSLIRGNLPEAEAAYRNAVPYAGMNSRLISRARTETRSLLGRTGHPANQLDACFNLPPIVVCSGQMFDKPEQTRMRFPFGMEGLVREEIKRKLATINARIGFSSLSSGGELLFAEEMLERGGEIHIVLPCNRQEFRLSNVDLIPGAKFGERFDQVLAKAASVTILEENWDDTDVAGYEYCNRILSGNALLKARSLQLDVVPLVICCNEQCNGIAPTRNFVELWKQQQTPVEVIRLDKILEQLASLDTFVRRRQTLEKNSYVQESPGVPETPARTIKAVLFADIMGHSRMSNEQMPKFIQHFLMKVSASLEALPKPPLVRNTWGDTIHCVFDDVSQAGSFALTLQELTQKTDWSALGLPSNLNVRVSLHAGPVYPCVDPVSEKLTFLGPHVKRGAAIEPIADEGQIYATEAFATLSESHGAKDYVCEYVGQKQLPRRYETVPVFIVRRGSTAS